MQPYMELMAHELLDLYWHGVEVKLPDSLGGTQLVVHAMMLQWVCDYRGFPKCFRHSQSPALIGACYVCDQQGLRIPRKEDVPRDGRMSGKVVYPGTWRDCCDEAIKQQAKRYNVIEGQSSNPHRLTRHEDVVSAAQAADIALAAGHNHKSSHHPAGTTGEHNVHALAIVVLDVTTLT
jgi:hypothetical protein